MAKELFGFKGRPITGPATGSKFPNQHQAAGAAGDVIELHQAMAAVGVDEAVFSSEWGLGCQLQ